MISNSWSSVIFNYKSMPGVSLDLFGCLRDGTCSTGFAVTPGILGHSSSAKSSRLVSVLSSGISLCLQPTATLQPARQALLIPTRRYAQD